MVSWPVRTVCLELGEYHLHLLLPKHLRPPYRQRDRILPRQALYLNRQPQRLAQRAPKADHPMVGHEAAAVLAAERGEDLVGELLRAERRVARQPAAQRTPSAGPLSTTVPSELAVAGFAHGIFLPPAAPTM